MGTRTQRWEGVFQATLKPGGRESVAALPSPAAVYMAALCELGQVASLGRHRGAQGPCAVHNLCDYPSGPGTVRPSFIHPHSSLSPSGCSTLIS